MKAATLKFALCLVLFLIAGLVLSSCSKRGGAGRDFIATATTPPAPADPAPSSLLDRFQAIQQSATRLQDYRVDVQIEAALPAMHRQGGMQATRVQKGATELSYAGAQFTGDDSIKRDVITRYLNGEKESLRNPPNVRLVSEHYQFVYRGVAAHHDRRAHVYEVIPREKRFGLFRGELWLDMQTAQPLREFGRFVSNPSVFLKDVDFVRDYQIIDGRALPSRFISYMDTRLVGPAEIIVYFRNYQFDSSEP